MTNADCPPGTVCNGGVCGGTPGCMTDAECPAGYSCQNGVCSIACHPVINEVQVEGLAGTGDEFIELYNPCMVPADLTNFKVVYRSAFGVTDVPIANLSGFVMGPGSFIVLASSGYSGPGPFEFMFPANQLSSSGGGLGLYNNNGVLVDSVGYGTVMNIFVEGSPAPAAFMGQTIGRMPNGVDTNNNGVDFIVTPPTPHTFN
jgi:Cys-rich repeat protein